MYLSHALVSANLSVIPLFHESNRDSLPITNSGMGSETFTCGLEPIFFMRLVTGSSMALASAPMGLLARSTLLPARTASATNRRPATRHTHPASNKDIRRMDAVTADLNMPSTFTRPMMDAAA